MVFYFNMWFLWLAFVLAICLYLYFDIRKPRKYPPGPRWAPILGSALEVNELRKKTGYLYKAVNKMSKKYNPDGHLLGLKIGKDKIVIVNSLQANREMLYNIDIDGRPKGIFYETRTWGQRLGIIFTDGEHWKEQRRFLVKHLKEFGLGRSGMSEIVITECKQMVDDVLKIIQDSNEGSTILQMQNFFSVYTLNTLWTMIAGVRYKLHDPEMKVLQSIIFDLLKAIDMVGALFSHFPILSVVCPSMSGYKHFVESHERIWKFLRDEIARHKITFDPDKEVRNVMDAYLRVLKENGGMGSYSEGQLVAICLDMFIAGMETTAKTMSFCFNYLIREQEVQKKAQEEIDHVLGRDKKPNLNDRLDMPYNEAIVYESLRHILGRTFGVPHRAVKDTTLMGYNIPKDTMVLNNYTSIMMNEDIFPDPQSFKPERFLKDGKVVLPNSYFPFGLARRRCIGETLAKCQIFIFTTTLLQQFSFLPVPGEPLPSLEHVDGATPSPAPFRALVVPRY